MTALPVVGAVTGERVLRVLVACEFSGCVRDAFIEAGHDAVSCDLLPSEAPGPHIQGDVRDVLGDGWDLMIAHPPCTRMTRSGFRWIYNPPKGRTVDEMQRDLREGVALYVTLRDAPIPRKCLENPRMHPTPRAMIGPANVLQYFQPHQFGDETFKETGLELFGLPPLVPTNRLTPPARGTPEYVRWSWVHRCPPSPQRWKIRSRFSRPVAQAMAAQWGTPS